MLHKLYFHWNPPSRICFIVAQVIFQTEMMKDKMCHIHGHYDDYLFKKISNRDQKSIIYSTRGTLLSFIVKLNNTVDQTFMYSKT